MTRSDKTSQIIDTILKISLTSGALAGSLAFPGLIVALADPLEKYFKHLDNKEREREVRRVLSYMKWQKLITDDYEFGLKITDKGQERLAEADFNNLHIEQVKKWDGKWRIVFYDIPEKHKQSRNALIFKLKGIGFYQLQRSVWIHPLPCRNIIESICTRYEVAQYVTYLESTYIDNQSVLIDRFKPKLPKTKFSINRAIA